MKGLAQAIPRGVFLSVATLFVLLLAWLEFTLVSNGLDATLMGFESEPLQGYNYWRWFFIKRNLFGIAAPAGIIAILAGVVLWGWVAFVRDFARGRYIER